MRSPEWGPTKRFAAVAIVVLGGHLAPSAVGLAPAQSILADDPDFATLYERLAAGRTYAADVPTGRIDGIRTNRAATPHPYVLLVPETYEADRRYPLRIWLHGGVSRPPYRTPGAWWSDYDRTASEEWLTLIPASWNASKWWEASQSENLAGLLSDVRATYNVDENRVSLLGISDGGSGVYFHAARSSTPYAAFLPFIGHVAVVNNPRMGVDGEVYALNFLNKPFYIVNTENDRLYPYHMMAPYVERWREAGAEIIFRPIDGAGHDLSWMSGEAPRIEAFLGDVRRDPLPDTLVWRTERTDAYNRLHWVEILELGSADGERRFPRIPGLAHRGPSGRISVLRTGNSVAVETEGVRRYRLLLSPEEFDFGRPVEVTTNGRLSFRGRVVPDRDVLLRWYARDDDRTMLFAAELEIDLGVPDAN